MINQSRQMWVDIGSQRGQALNLADLGRVRHQKRDYDRALDILRQAHAAFTAIGDPDQIDTLNSLGDLALEYPPAGDPHALFSQAHTLARAIGTALYEAQALAGLGRCAHRAHDIPTATTTFAQALTIYQRLGSPEAATITDYLADLHHNPDQHAKPQ